MWTSGRTAGLHTYLVTMAAASDKTALSTNSGSGEAQFTATTFGHLQISNVDVSTPLNLYLSADAGTGKTLQDLVAYFNANGLSAQAVNYLGTNGPADTFDVKLTFAVPSAATQYFGWDLSDFNSSATLSAVALPEPASLGMVSGLAGLVLSRRRVRRQAAC